ncbi:MAG: hypothetical protein ACI81R_002869 [Bradymonadia bacterium]|jgi:hypothetical protein
MIRSLSHFMLAFVLVVTTSAAVPCACDENDHGSDDSTPSADVDRAEATTETAAHNCCPSESDRDATPEEEACPHCEMGTCDTMAVDDGQTTVAAVWGGFELPSSPSVPVFAVSRPALAAAATTEPDERAVAMVVGDSGRDICVRNQVFLI